MADLTWDVAIGRINVVFSLAGGDIATNTLHVACVDDELNPSTMDVVDLETVAETVMSQFTTLYNGNSGLYQGCVLNHIDAYVLGATAPHNAVIKTSVTGTSPHGSANQGLPPECAVAMSLYGFPPNEFVTFPASRRGRIFLPGVTTPWLTSEGLLSGTGLGAIADFGKSLGEAIWDTELSSGQRGLLVIASRTKNWLTPVVRVTVDDHVDVQRRRQWQMPYTKYNRTVVLD